MPPKVKVSKANILTAAVELVREQGIDALNARLLATRLGCSTQPIFSNYPQMQALRDEVLGAAYSRYLAFLRREAESGQYPAYKSGGMAYIRFAREEQELFRLLFMRNREQESPQEGEEVKPLLNLLENQLGLSHEQARMFHLQMWIYVHGIAVMEATAYTHMDMDFISRLLTDAFEGMKLRYQNRRNGE